MPLTSLIILLYSYIENILNKKWKENMNKIERRYKNDIRRNEFS